jgi:tol-pal system protein YbgF
MKSARALCVLALLLPALTAGAAEERGKPPTPEERIARLERLLENQGEIISRLDAMQRELQRLQGTLEEQGHDQGLLRQGQLNALRDFDRRLSEIEKTLAASLLARGAQASPAVSATESAGLPETEGAQPDGEASAPPEPAPPAAAAKPPSAKPSVASTEEEASYSEAFKLLKEAHYDKATAAFQDYLKRYPDGANADKAQYWLGETYYVTRRFKESLQTFQAVLEHYPGSDKRPDAALKIGFVHYETGAWADARKALNEVIKNYPGTAVARLADSRLQRMKKEGR